MIITRAARRYAATLLEVGKERDEVKALLDDMNFINNTINDSRELALFVQSPIIKYEDKQAVLEKLFGKQVQESTWSFIQLLIRKKRIGILHQVAQAYIEKYKKYAGIIDVEVSVAYELNSSQKKALYNALEKVTSQKADLSIHKDESLRGGMAVRIGDTVIDGTVRHKLQELEQTFHSAIVA
jgi:F-type H+-transporting ATPase subunit delta